MAEVVIGNVIATYEIRGRNVVLMCPPHPLFGGSRHDVRLDRISNALLRLGISVLRFDYMRPYRGGIGEIEDAKKCLSYLKDRHDFIIVLGYSFGSVVASNIARYCDLSIYISPIRAIDSIKFTDTKIPKLFIIATKDQIIPLQESLEIYEEASEPKAIVKLETDHFYFGKFDALSKAVVDYIKSNIEI